MAEKPHNKMLPEHSEGTCAESEEIDGVVLGQRGLRSSACKVSMTARELRGRNAKIRHQCRQ